MTWGFEPRSFGREGNALSAGLPSLLAPPVAQCISEFIEEVTREHTRYSLLMLHRNLAFCCLGNVVHILNEKYEDNELWKDVPCVYIQITVDLCVNRKRSLLSSRSRLKPSSEATNL